MTYTIQLDLFIDDSDIYTGEEIKDTLDLAMESVNCDASNIKVIEIND